ncbi:MAG: PH domain-containing protein [Burkholderiales bacterium]|nr:PH domain-containing protein [Burkholderiales bacterium]
MTPHPTLPDATAAAFEPERGPIWIAAEGQIVNVGTYVLCLLAFWLVVPLVYALYRFLVVNAHVYLLTDQRLRETSGLLFKSTEELELYRVKDISIEQPPRQRLVGRGRVILRTSDRSTPIVVLNAIPGPLAVADLLRDRIERCRVAKGVREID